MAQIAIPNKLLHILATCETAYAEASRSGYANNPDVIAAAADLKSVCRALAIANCNLTASKGPLGKAVATLRAHRACRAVRRACVKLQTTMEQVSEEVRLYHRFLMLFGSEPPERVRTRSLSQATSPSG
jgi:hypothetical protein